MYRVLLSLCLALLTLSAKDKYLDADAPELESIAQNTLQNAKIIDIQNAKVIDIIGITLGIEKVLEELNAKVSDTEIKIEMSGDILFDFDNASIRNVAEPTLNNIIEVIQKYHAKNILIEGHTDSKGSDTYNLKLSKKRADSVKNWLLHNSDINKNIIKTEGWGETKPIVENTNKDGSDNPLNRQKNRRVEITIKITAQQ